MDNIIPRQGTCAYCGNVGEVTDDPIIPQCLWPGRVPKNTPIIDACKPCNNEEKSLNDSYLRNFLTMDMDNEDHPLRQRILPKFFRAVQRDQSIFAHHAMQSQLLELRSESGLFRGYAYGIKLPKQRTTTELTTIVRGLYYAYIGSNLDMRLPEKTPFEVFRQRDMAEVETNVQVLLKLGGKSIVILCIF
jgi:hypothetical protein